MFLVRNFENMTSLEDGHFICHQVTGICELFSSARVDIRDYNTWYLVFCVLYMTVDEIGGTTQARVFGIFIKN